MFIEFGIINYQLLIPLIYPSLYQIRRLIHDDSKPFYELITGYFGYLLGGIVYFIIKYRMEKIHSEKENKNNKNECENENQKISLIENEENNSNILTDNDNDNNNENLNDLSSGNAIDQMERNKLKALKKRNRKKYLFLLVLALINLIPMTIECFTNKNIKLKYLNFKLGSSLFYMILFYIIFSRIILGYKLYAHQLLSLFIIIICISFLLLFYLIHEENVNYKALIFISLYLFFIMSLYSLYDVLEKKYFNKFMDSPYHLMYIIGIISLCILLIYELITVLIFGIENNDYNGFIFQIITNYKNNSYLYPLIFIADIISAFLWIAGIQLTIYFFSPGHIIISESLSQIITTIIQNTLKNYSIYSKIIIYFLFIIIVISSLIYNEVIIINLCSLNKNTKKKIITRAKIEIESLQTIKIDESVN